MKTCHPWLWPVLGAVTALTAGCSTATSVTQRTVMMHESMQATPQAYRRVIVVPIWFSTGAFCDTSLASNQLAQVNGDAGREAASIVATFFADRGYHVLGPVRAICGEQDLGAFDAETRRLLDQTRADFWRLGQDIRDEAGANVPNVPFRHKLQSPLLPLQAKLGVSQADAMVLVDSTAFLETPAGRRKRGVWNWTGAPVATTALYGLAIGAAFGGVPVGFYGETAAMRNPTAIEETMAMVDLHTQEVLLWSSITANGADIRDREQLQVALFNLLAGLPVITPETGKP